MSGPAVMSPTQETDPPPPYNRSAQQTATAADFQVREERVICIELLSSPEYLTNTNSVIVMLVWL